MLAAVTPELVERFRPLLPVGYTEGVEAYRSAALDLTPEDLSTHYTKGLTFFHEELVPRVAQTLNALSGGVLELDDFEGFAAGSDCDFISHLVEAVASRHPVRIFSGDWFGFRVGTTHGERIEWSTSGRGAALACLCIPSVRNGHLTGDMLEFLEGAETCLLNLNLYPTLRADERRAVAQALAPLLPRSVLSISFSRGFGLTASQLGVALVHREHPLLPRFRTQWAWHTYYYNAIAARAFLRLDPARLAAVDDARRAWVTGWLVERGLPALDTGSYYVKSFRYEGEVPPELRPLVREDLVRLCFKPPQS